MLTHIHGPSGNQTHNSTVEARPPAKGRTLRLCGHWNQQAYLSKHPDLPGVMLCFWESSSQWCEGKQCLHNIRNHCFTHSDESICPSKRWEPLTQWQSITSQRNWNLKNTAVRISNLALLQAMDSKDAVPFNKWLCFIYRCESSPSRCRDCMSVHKNLSPLFIRFNTSSLFAWTKTIHSTGTQDICNSTGQGIFWSHYYKIYIVFFTPCSNNLGRKNAF